MANMSQAELSKCVGISYQQVQKYESGINRISAALLYTFAKAFGCSPNSFFVGLKDRQSDYSTAPVLTSAEMDIIKALRTLDEDSERVAMTFLHFLHFLQQKNPFKL